jgi:hypothetical protein
MNVPIRFDCMRLLFGNRHASKLAVEGDLMNRCDACGLTDAQALAAAKTIGLKEEFNCGIYSCCEVSAWADEQCLAWVEAVEEDEHAQQTLKALDESGNEPALVPVHLRRSVPWYWRA